VGKKLATISTRVDDEEEERLSAIAKQLNTSRAGALRHLINQGAPTPQEPQTPAPESSPDPAVAAATNPPPKEAANAGPVTTVYGVEDLGPDDLYQDTGALAG